jgi:hypothetical protein
MTTPDIQPRRLTADELIAKLDAACLGRKPEQSLRRVTNGGHGFWIEPNGGGRDYISTHIDADLCALADVIEQTRQEAQNGA